MPAPRDAATVDAGELTTEGPTIEVAGPTDPGPPLRPDKLEGVPGPLIGDRRLTGDGAVVDLP